jgi:bifunctional DNase/RNase
MDGMARSPFSSAAAATLIAALLTACQVEPIELDGRAMAVPVEEINEARDNPSDEQVNGSFVVADNSQASPPEGYVTMMVQSRSGREFGNAVLLVDPNEEIVVPIFIGGTEALSIRLRLAKRKFMRPLTHDLLDSSLKSLGATMLRAQVDSLDKGVYHGTVVLQKDHRVIKLDARPSDAIALAIGNGVPVLVSRQVLDEAGIRADRLAEDTPKPTVNPVAL